MVLKNPDIAENSQRHRGNPREFSTKRERERERKRERVCPRSLVKVAIVLHDNPPVQNTPHCMRWRVLEHPKRPHTVTLRLQAFQVPGARAEGPGVIQRFQQCPGSFLVDDSRPIGLACQPNGCLSKHVNF